MFSACGSALPKSLFGFVEAEVVRLFGQLYKPLGTAHGIVLTPTLDVHFRFGLSPAIHSEPKRIQNYLTKCSPPPPPRVSGHGDLLIVVQCTEGAWLSR